jgi:hypothetical protein
MKETSSAMKAGFLALLAAVTIPELTSAFGRDDRWTAGFGQGVCEAVVTSGAGNQIYLACDCGSDRPSSISFTLAGRSAPGDRILLAFDSFDAESIWIADGEIISDCRACAANSDYVLQRLKRHSRVRVMFQNGDAATFSLKGSSEAIGDCRASF